MFPSKTMRAALVLALVLGSTSCGFAESFSIKRALLSDEAKGKLDPNIKLYFSGQGHEAVSEAIGEWKSQKSSNTETYGLEGACQRNFLTALDALQRRANKMGGNAVIDIVSYHQGSRTSSSTSYSCDAGPRTSVFLVGKVVRIGK